MQRMKGVAMGANNEPGAPGGSEIRDKPPSKRPLWLAVAAVAVLVMVGAVGVFTQLSGMEDPDDTAEAEPAGGQDEVTQWDDVREDLGVSPAEFAQRWNDAVTAAGAGRPLEPLTPTNSSGFHDLPASTQQLEGVGRAQVVLAPDEDVVVMATLDQATPTGEAQQRGLFATMQAGVSAATGLSPDEAGERLRSDLDVSADDMSADHHNKVARIEGVSVGVFAAHGTWEFFVEKKPD